MVYLGHTDMSKSKSLLQIYSIFARDIPDLFIELKELLSLRVHPHHLYGGKDYHPT